MAKWYDNRFVSMLDSKTQMKIRNALECKRSALLHAMVARVNDLAGTIDIAKIMGYDTKDVRSISVFVGTEKRWT